VSKSEHASDGLIGLGTGDCLSLLMNDGPAMEDDWRSMLLNDGPTREDDWRSMLMNDGPALGDDCRSVLLYLLFLRDEYSSPAGRFLPKFAFS
jgi:hypothetical protein